MNISKIPNIQNQNASLSLQTNFDLNQAKEGKLMKLDICINGRDYNKFLDGEPVATGVRNNYNQVIIIVDPAEVFIEHDNNIGTMVRLKSPLAKNQK